MSLDGPVPDLVAVGHVTLNRAGGGERPGGAGYYAAVTASRRGLRVGLLTSFAGDFPVSALPPGFAVVNVPSRLTTIFEVGHGSADRTLRLLARAADIGGERSPLPWPPAPVNMT